MSSRDHTPIALKTIFRADFDPSLAYLSVFGSAAQKVMARGYTNFQVDGTKISLLDSKQRRSAVVEPASIVYSQNNADEGLEVQSISEILDIWPNVLEIAEYRRLGLRKWFVIPTKSAFEHVVSLFSSRALRMEEIGGFMPKAQDVYVRFECVEEPHKILIKVGPLKRQNIAQMVEELNIENLTKETQKLLESYPETGVHVDIDFIRFGSIIKREEITNFAIAGRKRCKEIVEKWADFLFRSDIDV